MVEDLQVELRGVPRFSKGGGSWETPMVKGHYGGLVGIIRALWESVSVGFFVIVWQIPM